MCLCRNSKLLLFLIQVIKLGTHIINSEDTFWFLGNILCVKWHTILSPDTDTTEKTLVVGTSTGNSTAASSDHFGPSSALREYGYNLCRLTIARTDGKPIFTTLHFGTYKNPNRINTYENRN